MTSGWNRKDNDMQICLLEKGVVEVQDTVRVNMEKLMKRGEKMEDLEVKAKELQVSASRFQTATKTLRNKMYCKKVTYAILLVVLLIIVITIVAVLIARPWRHS